MRRRIRIPDGHHAAVGFVDLAVGEGKKAGRGKRFDVSTPAMTNLDPAWCMVYAVAVCCRGIRSARYVMGQALLVDGGMIRAPWGETVLGAKG